jgi:hypothetical protein
MRATIFLLVLVLVAAPGDAADKTSLVVRARQAAHDADARALLDVVRERYRAIRTLSVDGENVQEMTMFGKRMVQTIQFVARASRDGTYLVKWATSEVTGAPAAAGGNAGAVWNAGTGAFNYLAQADAWAKAVSDEVALAAATGVSGGATTAIELVQGPWSPLDTLESPTLEAPADVDGERCYVLAGKSAGSTRVVFWISRRQVLVRQVRQSMALPPGPNPMEKLDDAAIDEAIKAMGAEPTPEARKGMAQMRDLAKFMHEHAGEMDGYDTQTYRSVVVDRPLTEADVTFTVPPGTAFKASMLDGVFGHAPASGRP